METVTPARRALDAVRVLAELNGDQPNDEQRFILQSFPGWGPAAKLFDGNPSGDWAALAEEFEETASAAMTSAARVCDTSFYTPPSLIGHIYDVLRSAGFDGGRVLDLGCGSGRFMTHAPDDLNLEFTGVEVDPTSAGIAAALNPDAKIINKELQKVTLPHGRFDAAVGNVPFSNATVHDGALDYDGSLHTYFLLRAVQAVRPGGYVVAVSSRHTMDAQHGLDPDIREHADLVAAVRLPSRYFVSDGTDVVADVMMLRVRAADEPESGFFARFAAKAPRFGWYGGERPTTYLRDYTTTGRCGYATISRYWEENPLLVAGTMRLTGWDMNPLAVDAASDRAGAVSRAFGVAMSMLVAYPKRVATAGALTDVALTDADGRKEGSFHIIDGSVMRVIDAKLAPVARASKKLPPLIKLRDAALELMAAESDLDRSDSSVEPLRITCRKLYEAYTGRYGALNHGDLVVGKVDPDTGSPRLSWRTDQLGGFRKDPDAPVVLALESYDQDNDEGQPAPILLRRVNRRPQPALHAETPGEALAISLGEGRGVDLARIASLLGFSQTYDAVKALGEMVYRDPVDGSVVIARDYLSGNVREKLRQALEAAEVDESYTRNVEALRGVQPPWLGRDEIRIELGSPFVAAGDIVDFAEEVFGAKVEVTHCAPIATWEVQSFGALSPQARVDYCTDRLDAFTLLQMGLNGHAPIIYDEVPDDFGPGTRKVRNADETERAEQKLLAIAERFSVWVWEHPAREKRITETYNNTLNAHVLRQHDGSHLTFPGLADGLELWKWQRDFVDQAVVTPGVFAAHEVGLGKTLTAITTAMTLKQFGLVNRPAFIVPNHLIEQATRQCYQAWPGGKFLIVSRDDLHADARRRFIARCATGDWDIVIMTHETFSSIPVPVEVERDWLDAQLGFLEDYMRQSGTKGKQIARAVRSLKGRLDKLRDDYNDGQELTFPMLAIDYLLVDEADKFRRLPVTTRADGFSMGSSKRATDLLLKVSMMRNANQGKPFGCFLTGTPFTNTLAEGYVWQQFLAPEQLVETGLTHFDAWAATFVRYEVLIEVKPDGGGFSSKRRPAVIQNVPEYRTMLARFMSMVRGDVAGLPRPAPRRETVVVQPTEATRAYMSKLVERADKLRARTAKDEDNMLLICNDGRKVALDPNLVRNEDGSLVDTEAPKLDAVAERVAQTYRRTRYCTYDGSERPGAFQLVLCDLGTPRSGNAQSYGRIRGKLIEEGVPADEIRFVHEATNPKAREAIFAACRDGRIAVLFGSTPKVGIGTNVQDRLHTLHHVDPTWTAAAWEQRNGRGIRHGNQHAEVRVIAYVVQTTFDAFMFQTIERKARAFAQLYRTDVQVREIEDLGDASLSFGELKAAAAGNDLLLRQHKLATQIRKLRLAHVGLRQNLRTLTDQAAHYDTTAESLWFRADRLDKFAKLAARYTNGEIGLSGEDAAEVCGVEAPPSTYRWTGGITVDIDMRYSGDRCVGRFLRLQYNRRTLWSTELPWKVRRGGFDVVMEWSSQVVNKWLSGVGGEIQDTQRRAMDAEQRAADARATIAATDMSEPPELVAARAQLQEVNQLIDAELRDKGKAAA